MSSIKTPRFRCTATGDSMISRRLPLEGEYEGFSEVKNFIIELAQTKSGYVPMPECFERGGYEVQPNVDSCAPNAATEIIKAAIENL